MVGCALLVACVMYGCRDDEQPKEEARESQTEESTESPSSEEQAPPERKSEQSEANTSEAERKSNTSKAEPVATKPEPEAELSPSSATKEAKLEADSSSGSASSDSENMPKGKALKFATAAEAKGFGERQLAKAERAAKNGKMKDAYKATLAGWQALQPHCGDGACKGLSDQLLARMEEYGEQMASVSAGGDGAIRRPLKIR